MKRMIAMLVKPLVITLIGSSLFAPGMQAQSDTAMTFSVPFPFTVGSQTIPPGTYQLSLVSNPFHLSVVDVRHGHRELFSVRPEQQCAVESQGRLLFRKSGSRRLLYEIHFPGSNMFTEVIQRDDVEKNIASHDSTGTSTSLGKE